MNVHQKINLRAQRKAWEPGASVARIPYEKKAKPRKCGFYNPEFKSGRGSYRWIENCEAAGLRLVGYADELYKGIGHRGWFTNNDGYGEIYRGIVYRLPARNGQNVYMAGYADPNNNGCALLSTELHYEAAADDLNDVARFADRIAEHFAEQERDYQRAWSAVSMAKDAADEARQAARDALELVRELEKCDGPKIQKAIKSEFCDALKQYRKAMSSLVDALNNDQGITLAHI